MEITKPDYEAVTSMDTLTLKLNSDKCLRYSFMNTVENYFSNTKKRKAASCNDILFQERIGKWESSCKKKNSQNWYYDDDSEVYQKSKRKQVNSSATKKAYSSSETTCVIDMHNVILAIDYVQITCCLKEILWTSCYAGCFETVRRIINMNSDYELNLHQLGRNNWSPLLAALSMANASTAKLLLQEQFWPNVNEVTGQLNSALHLAIWNRKNFGRTPLQQAVEKDDAAEVKILLYKVNIDEQDNLGRTALHIAASCDNFMMFRILFSALANDNIKNDKGDTALDIAETNECKEIIAFLNFDALENKSVETVNTAKLYENTEILQNNETQQIRECSAEGAKVNITLKSGKIKTKKKIYSGVQNQNKNVLDISIARPSLLSHEDVVLAQKALKQSSSEAFGSKSSSKANEFWNNNAQCEDLKTVDCICGAQRYERNNLYNGKFFCERNTSKCLRNKQDIIGSKSFLVETHSLKEAISNVTQNADNIVNSSLDRTHLLNLSNNLNNRKSDFIALYQSISSIKKAKREGEGELEQSSKRTLENSLYLNIDDIASEMISYKKLAASERGDISKYTVTSNKRRNSCSPDIKIFSSEQSNFEFDLSKMTNESNAFERKDVRPQDQQKKTIMIKKDNKTPFEMKNNIAERRILLRNKIISISNTLCQQQRSFDNDTNLWKHQLFQNNDTNLWKQLPPHQNDSKFSKQQLSFENDTNFCKLQESFGNDTNYSKPYCKRQRTKTSTNKGEYATVGLFKNCVFSFYKNQQQKQEQLSNQMNMKKASLQNVCIYKNTTKQLTAYKTGSKPKTNTYSRKNFVAKQKIGNTIKIIDSAVILA